jgi:hypothetical protein
VAFTRLLTRDSPHRVTPIRGPDGTGKSRLTRYLLTRNTPKPVASLWKVTRSINPDNPSWIADEGGLFMR